MSLSSPTPVPKALTTPTVPARIAGAEQRADLGAQQVGVGAPVDAVDAPAAVHDVVAA